MLQGALLFYHEVCWPGVAWVPVVTGCADSASFVACPGRGPGGGGGGARQDAPIEHSVACSLEELYRGVTKRLKISRNVASASGRAERVAETLSVDVKPGWKRGTRVTFPKKGAAHLNAEEIKGK